MTRGPAKQFDREVALERAMHLFWNQGYEATGMTELLEHMKIGRQSLYDTFGDKHSLYIEALERYLRERLEIARGVLRSPDSPLGNLKRFFAKMMEMAVAAGPAGCFGGNSLSELGASDPEVARVTGRFFGELEDEFREVISAAQGAGEIPGHLDPSGLATLMLTTTQGLALMSRLEHESGKGKRVMETTFSLLQGR